MIKNLNKILCIVLLLIFNSWYLYGGNKLVFSCETGYKYPIPNSNVKLDTLVLMIKDSSKIQILSKVSEDSLPTNELLNLIMALSFRKVDSLVYEIKPLIKRSKGNTYSFFNRVEFYLNDRYYEGGYILYNGYLKSFTLISNDQRYYFDLISGFVTISDEGLITYISLKE